MERITYRITLDTHKSGIQRTLQGFETADNMSRRIAINLVASGDTYEIPLDHVVAMMYVTTPHAEEPSINECVIEDNTIIYDVLPIVEEGITEMQIKLIETRTNGAKSVLVAPKFVVEVTESGADDEGAEQTTTFTSLETAVAQAKEVYDSRLLRIDISKECVFTAYYADGTVYENDYLNEALYNGNALLSESFARGGTGIREGEDTDNAEYYSALSKSASISANDVADEAKMLLDEVTLRAIYTVFAVDFETGNLNYLTSHYAFAINETTGELEVDGGENYSPEQLVGEVVEEFIDEKSDEIDEKIDEAISIAKGKNQARVFDTTTEMNEWLSDEANKGISSVGDNLYIKDLEVPDWWIAEVLTEVDADTGFYYKISQLETSKVDVTEIVNDTIATLGVRYKPETGMVQILHDGEWVDWKQTGLVVLFLYKDGEIFKDVTGGYEAVLIDDNMQYGTATLDLNADGFISATFTNSGIRLQTVNKDIDLTSYSTVEIDYIIECTGTASASNYTKLSIVTEDGTTIAEEQMAYSEMQSSPSGTITLELSGDRQNVYFELLSVYSGTAIIKISEIRATK